MGISTINGISSDGIGSSGIGGGGISGSSFSPLDLSGLFAWYDPSDLSTLFQDSAGTTPVTADGQPVGRMLDKSGNGNHATQSTSASRPTYRTDGTLHWIETDGVDDFMLFPSSNLDSGAFYFGIHDMTAATTARVLISGGVGGYIGTISASRTVAINEGAVMRPVDTPSAVNIGAKSSVRINKTAGTISARTYDSATENTNSVASSSSSGLSAANTLFAFSSGAAAAIRSSVYGVILCSAHQASIDDQRALDWCAGRAGL